MDDHNSKLRFLERLLGKSKYSSNTKEALFYCPFCHHHKPKLSINLQTDRWQCFPCGKAGKKSLLYIIRHVGTKEDIETYLNHYAAKKNLTYKNYITTFKVTLPDEFVPLISCKNSVIAGRKVWNYLIGRGITEEDILRYKIGTAFEGLYKNKIIFPSFDNKGNVNLFTARSFNGSYMSPSVPPDYKNTIILNELNINWSKPVIIVEGFVDMLKTTGNAVPLFGSSLVKESRLFEEIVMNKSIVYLALDADVKAQQKKYKIAKNFMGYGVSVYDVSMGSFNVVGEMTKKDFAIVYKNATLLSHDSVLRNRMRAI